MSNKPGKAYKERAARVDRDKAYSVSAALDILLENRRTTFDETAEIAINLGVDPRHAEQNVRGAVVLPNGTGKSVRVIVFARGDKEREAREAGADAVGGDDLAKRITDENWLDFDRVIATPDMMGVVGRLGRVLGPRGLMPNPRVGTVTFDIAKAVEEQKGGKISFRVDRAGIVHAAFGKASFSKEKLEQNLRAVTDAIMKAKPPTAKGTYLKKVSISTTMGPGIRLDNAEFQAAAV
jgi:large subunit ribosomal protein L1